MSVHATLDGVRAGETLFTRLVRRFDGGFLLSLMLFVALFGGWQLAVNRGLMPAFVLPAPTDVALRVVEDAMLPRVHVATLYTLTAILVGFAIAAILGIALGAAIALVPLLDRVLSPYIIALQTIPKVAIAPILIIWFGMGIESKIVIVALIDFFPILVNAAAGFRNIDPRQILLMNAINASPWQIFVKVRVPNAMPYLMAGIYISMVFSVIGAVVGEFIGSTQGLGSEIVQRQAVMDVVGVFSMLVILTLIGIALNAITRLVAKRLVFWADSENPSGV
ncbi:ABC transporter permease [Reyranella sp. CPCC 100927]|uniref:ABC transporter permease n=1 Tax=Reyranella sp. CPCC 100927 TaxID=2599616 RepID=UPI0011B37DC7|nr:ABC transporter permease [Reyranella sp. CPCC 100927]TWS98512.1 ABC transporter permease [Reyranella sp. CPCC 100927]